MLTPDTSAELAATRKLIGLSAAELAAELSVNPASVRDWERGRFTPSEGLRHDLATLRTRHDQALATLIAYHDTEGGIVALPDEPMPRSWYLALGARLIDRRPDAMLDWA